MFVPRFQGGGDAPDTMRKNTAIMLIIGIAMLAAGCKEEAPAPAPVKNRIHGEVNVDVLPVAPPVPEEYRLNLAPPNRPGLFVPPPLADVDLETADEMVDIAVLLPTGPPPDSPSPSSFVAPETVVAETGPAAVIEPEPPAPPAGAGPETPPPVAGPHYTVQVASFASMAGANRERDRLLEVGLASEIREMPGRNGRWYGIWCGRFSSKEEAVKAARGWMERQTIREYIVKEVEADT